MGQISTAGATSQVCTGSWPQMVPVPSSTCLFGIQPWNIFRIIRRQACSQEHRKHSTNSNLTSVRLSGAWSTSIARHRILVSWEKLPQEHKHNENKGNVNLPCASEHHSFSQCSPHLLQYCYQFLSLHSWLWNSTISLYYCKQRRNLIIGLLHSLWAAAFPPDLNLPKPKEGRRKPASLHAIHMETHAHA